jgi:hypothetical protein
MCVALSLVALRQSAFGNIAWSCTARIFFVFLTAQSEACQHRPNGSGRAYLVVLVSR